MPRLPADHPVGHHYGLRVAKPRPGVGQCRPRLKLPVEVGSRRDGEEGPREESLFRLEAEGDHQEHHGSRGRPPGDANRVSPLGQHPRGPRPHQRKAKQVSAHRPVGERSLAHDREAEEHSRRQQRKPGKEPVGNLLRANETFPGGRDHHQPGARQQVEQLAAEHQQKVARLEGHRAGAGPAGLKAERNPAVGGIPDERGQEADHREGEREPEHRRPEEAAVFRARHEEAEGRGPEEHGLILGGQRQRKAEPGHQPATGMPWPIGSDEVGQHQPQRRQEKQVERPIGHHEVASREQKERRDRIPGHRPQAGRGPIRQPCDVVDEPAAGGSRQDEGEPHEEDIF